MSEAPTAHAESYRIADLLLEVDSARVFRGDHEIALPKLSFDLLTALARRAPAVATFDQLMDDVWGQVVVSPETVTQRVKLVREALGDDSKNPRYVAPVRGRGYRLVPDVKTVSDTIEPAAEQRSWLKWPAIASVGLAGIAIVVWSTSVREVPRDPASAPPIDPVAIAILPFDDMSNNPANAAFAAGIHDDVLTKVSQIGALHVISRTSVELLDPALPVPEIARALGVAAVLEGSVQRTDDSVRINVQLIDGGRDVHLWSQTYDRQLNLQNVFAIQSDIAAQIASSLKARMTDSESERLQSAATNNFAAYEAYQLGRDRMRNRNTSDLELAREHFERAIELDPDYALAHLGLAKTLRLLSSYGTLPGASARERIKALIDQALALDDGLGQAYAERGRLYSNRLDFAAAEADFITAQRLAPNHSAAYEGYARLLAIRNRNDEALDNYRLARQLDPLGGGINADLGWALAQTGRYDEALAQFERTVEIAPNYAGGYRSIAELYWTVFGRLDLAYAWRKKVVELDPGDPVNPAVLGLICLDVGDASLAEYWIDRSLALGAERRRPYWAKEALHLYRGEHAESIEYAGRVLEIDPKFRFTVTHLRNFDTRSGRDDDALARYRAIFPEFLDDPDPKVEYWNYIAAIDIAYLYQQRGNRQRASMLLQKSLRALDDMRRLGPSGFAIADVEIYALQGKRKLALATLREAVENGWRMQWWFWLDQSPNLDSIRNDPEFRAIRDIIVASSSSQLQRIRGHEPAR